MDTSSTASYSYSWAVGVVRRLEESYPRATELTYKILGITRHNLATYLRIGDPVFPQIREFIHRIEKVQNYAKPPLSMSEIYYTMSKYYPKNMSARLRDRLTARAAEIMLEEQWMKGGNPEPKAMDSFLSSFGLPKVVDDGYGPQLCLGADEIESVGTKDGSGGYPDKDGSVWRKPSTEG